MTEEIKTLQREVKDFEPMLALDGGMDGLNVYRRIAAEAEQYVAAGGILIMEVGAGEAEAVAALFQEGTTTIVKDFNGVDRYVRIVF